MIHYSWWDFIWYISPYILHPTFQHTCKQVTIFVDSRFRSIHESFASKVNITLSYFTWFNLFISRLIYKLLLDQGNPLSQKTLLILCEGARLWSYIYEKEDPKIKFHYISKIFFLNPLKYMLAKSHPYEVHSTQKWLIPGIDHTKGTFIGALRFP